MEYTVTNFVRTLIEKSPSLIYEHVDLATAGYMAEIYSGKEGFWVVLPDPTGKVSFAIRPITENTDFRKALGVLNPATDIMYQWPHMDKGTLRFVAVQLLKYVKKEVL